MNTTMRFLSSIIIFFVVASVAIAQTGQPSSSVPTSKPRTTTTPPRTVDKKERNIAVDRSSSSSKSSQAGRSTRTGLQPSATTLRNNPHYNTPSRPSQSNGSTAKSVYRAPKKIAALKASERVAVQWLTLEQAMEKCKTEKRKIFVDVYTDWCGWCKHMDSTTFVTPAVANYLNKYYYAVKFNAEQVQDITFKGKTYQFKKVGSRGYHELAALWLNNRLSYPTVVFLDESLNLIQPVPGYQDATKMEAIINYFGSDNHKKTPWETYEKTFSSGDQK
jgi:thioredoxin-related protein